MILENLMAAAVPAPNHIWSDSCAFAFGNVRWYSIFIITGFAIAILGTCLKLWKRYNLSIEPFYWFILIGVPVSIFGANFGSCVLGEPAGKPWSQFFTSFGTGLAIEWGVLFCFGAGCIYFPLVLKLPRYRVRDEFGPTPTVRKVSMWLYFDAVMPCVLIAQCIGRWGNYFNQEVFGSIVTNDRLAWFLHDCLPYMYSGGHYYQPLFLWEMLLNLGGFLLLYVGAEFIKVRKTGDISAAYYVWYGIIRLCLEPLRDIQFKSRATMITSVVYVVGGVLFIFINHFFLAKARDKKAAKALFSIYFIEFFTSFFCRTKQIIKPENLKDEKKINHINCLNNKVQNTNIHFQNNINKKTNYLIEKTEKWFHSCETKITADIKRLSEQKPVLQEQINQAHINQLNAEQIAKLENNLKLNTFEINDLNSRLNHLNDWYKKRITTYQKRFVECEETLKNVKEKNEQWSLPKDYLRTEQEKLYYGRW